MPSPALPRLVLIGGFLAAGKTTMLARTGMVLGQRGLRVAMIVNDHAPDVVDTCWLAHQGFIVGGGSTGGFGSRCDALVDAADKLSALYRPDVILAEPVGSGTAFAGPVVQPSQHHLAGRYTVGPLVVVVDPAWLLGMLGEAVSPMPLEVSYVYRQQLEAADLLVINKVDHFAFAEVAVARALLVKRFPDKPILATSALTGMGFEAVVDHLQHTSRRGGLAVAHRDSLPGRWGQGGYAPHFRAPAGPVS